MRSRYDESFTSVYYDEFSKQINRFIIFNDMNPSTNVYCLKNLQMLRLNNTNLTLLPDIKNLQQLNTLIIQSDNGAIDQHLPSEFVQLISLSVLELTDIRNLEDLPDEIQFLTQLGSLKLQMIPNLKKIPDESFSKLTSLNKMKLINLPKLSNIPIRTSYFQSLQELEITKTNISELYLSNLTNLRILTITSNSILKSIQIINMPFLYNIYIEYNAELLTLKLGNLHTLQTLTIISNTKLISLDIENVSPIRTISITDSAQLKRINLKKLDILDKLELSSLGNLESISVDSAQQLNSISINSSPLLKNISFINIPSIISFNLSNCQLLTFPESILKLKTLQILVMTSNQLSTLPSTLSSDLLNLRVLNLTNNRLQRNIYQPITRLNLTEFYLNNNSLTSIDGISEYKSLQRLELDNNQIALIPSEIMKLSSRLKTLSINYNQLTNIPYSMTNMRSLNIFLAMKNYISDFQRQYLLKLFQQTQIQVNF